MLDEEFEAYLKSPEHKASFRAEFTAEERRMIQEWPEEDWRSLPPVQMSPEEEAASRAWSARMREYERLENLSAKRRSRGGSRTLSGGMNC